MHWLPAEDIEILLSEQAIPQLERELRTFKGGRVQTPQERYNFHIAWERRRAEGVDGLINELRIWKARRKWTGS